MTLPAARPAAAVAVLLAAALAGCGARDPDRPQRRVTGAVAIPAAARAPLAVSARAGYGGVAHVARAAGPSFVVRGAVEPADARVSVADARTGEAVEAAVGRDGAFAARLGGLRRGASAFVISGTRPGRRRWVESLVVVRDGAPVDPPASVVVPERDRTPPVAILRLQLGRTGGARRAGVVEAFTGTQSSPARPVAVRGTTLRATGVTRDADGGALRSRVTVTADLLCRSRGTGAVQRRRKVWRRPPAAIERLVVPPGRRLPTTLTRTVRIDLAGRDCAAERLERIEGQVEADATNGSELEEATPIYFVATP